KMVRFKINILHLSLLLIVLIISCKTSIHDETKDFALGKSILVGPEDFNSSFSYYNTTPESPDGNNIAYVKFLAETSENRSEKVAAEIWVCNSNLSNHKKIVTINPLAVHNGARVQWVNNQTIAYEDDSIRVVDLSGTSVIKAVYGRLGHETYNGKILYSANGLKTNYSTIYEYNIKNQQITNFGNVMDFKDLVDHFNSEEFIDPAKFRILHLQYSPDGSKIAFRLDVGPRNEKFKHLVTMDINGDNVHYFGPKPMHFSWYDDESIMAHDNQIDDGWPNDKSSRRWDQQGSFIETLSGPGNHLGASFDRKLYASESWYGTTPVIISVFKKGQSIAYWKDTVSLDAHTTWTLAYHINPSF
ncbi:MAG: hypothetical protein KAQ79_11150, partial [Cyclobacteriaceae bacterium]|nr:hypothetical protein [Cyclobacteriaceae bacterium]